MNMEKEIIDVNEFEEIKEEQKPMLEKANYIIEIITDDKSKKTVVVNAAINIQKIGDSIIIDL